MWKITCYSNMAMVVETHSKERALKDLDAHIHGIEEIGLKPCGGIHKIVDDGRPCMSPNCTIPYRRAWTK